MSRYNLVILGLMVLAGVLGYTQGADPDPSCGTTAITSGTGTIPFPKKGKTCTWTITVTDDKQVNIRFDSVALGTKATLEVKSGTGNLTVPKSGTGPYMLVSLTKVTTIVLKQTDDDNSTYTASYDTKNCSMEVTDSQGVFKSPMYLPGTGEVNCKYTANLGTNTNLPVVSFDTFNLVKGTLDVKFDNFSSTTPLTGSEQPDDLPGPAEATNITFDLKIQNVTEAQSFAVTFRSFDSDCSGEFKPTEVSTQLKVPASNVFTKKCYVRVRAEDKKNNVFLQNTITTSDKGADSYVFINGGSELKSVIADDDSEITWFVSDGPMMTIIASLGVKNTRTGGWTASEDAFSKLYLPDVTNSSTAILDETVVKNKTAWLQFLTSDKRTVELTMTRDKALTTETILVQSNSETEVFTFNKDTVLFPVMTTGKRALVKVTGLATGQKITIIAASVNNTDCNQLYSSESGVIISTGPIAKVTQCTVAVNTAKQTMVELSSVTMCENTTLTIFQGFKTDAKTLAKLTGSLTTATQIQFPAGSSPRFVWTQKDDSKCTTNAFNARYWASTDVCGSLGTATSGNITSPSYPNRYPYNTQCTWTIPTQADSLLFLSANTVDLAKGHSLTLMNKTVPAVPGVSYTGTTVPPVDILETNKDLTMVFSSNSGSVNETLTNHGQGVNVAYKILSCGGLQQAVTANLTSPSVSNKSVECIWIIELPPTGGKDKKDRNIVSATISIKGMTNTTKSKLEIHDGGSIRDGLVFLNLTKVNKTSTMKANVLSRTNNMMVHYTYVVPPTGANAVIPFTFDMTYKTYSCNTTYQCDDGMCIHPDWVCDQIKQCKDGSDETNCAAPIPGPTPAPTPAPKTDKGSTGVKGYWIAVVLFLGLFLGILLTIFLPRVIRKMKRRNYQPNSSYGTLHEDA